MAAPAAASPLAAAEAAEAAAAAFEAMTATTRTTPTAPMRVERAAMTMPWVRSGKRRRREARLQKREQQESPEDICRVVQSLSFAVTPVTMTKYLCSLLLLTATPVTTMTQ